MLTSDCKALIRAIAGAILILAVYYWAANASVPTWVLHAHR